jgi:DNA adenine methylase
MSAAVKARGLSHENGGASPFLKWAGGKRQLLPTLRRFYPTSFGRYYEPFLGSGAVFLDLARRGCLDGRAVMLSDSNADLIGCYLRLQHDVERVVSVLERLAVLHTRDPSGHYYRLRDACFNLARRRLRDRGGLLAERYPPALAAMLIYLNRTGFNGLFRVNAKGDFNVPLGRYTRPRICNAGNLHAVSALLRGPDVTLRHAGFVESTSSAHEGDFIYLDPPYAPLGPTSKFTSYTMTGFSPDDQRALQAHTIALAARGCFVVMSNSTADDIAALYEENASARAAGLRAWKVPARRAINSRASARGPVMEYVISTVEPREQN